MSKNHREVGLKNVKKKNSCQVIVLIANQERSNDMKGKTNNKLRVKRNFFFSGIKQEI